MSPLRSLKKTILHYRYAVKLMYDECSLGEVESLAELAEYLEEYDQKWCIVKETEESWEAAVLSNVSHLFSLGQDNNEVGKLINCSRFVLRNNASFCSIRIQHMF